MKGFSILSALFFASFVAAAPYPVSVDVHDTSIAVGRSKGELVISIERLDKALHISSETGQPDRVLGLKDVKLTLVVKIAPGGLLINQRPVPVGISSLRFDKSILSGHVIDYDAEEVNAMYNPGIVDLQLDLRGQEVKFNEATFMQYTLRVDVVEIDGCHPSITSGVVKVFHADLSNGEIYETLIATKEKDTDSIAETIAKEKIMDRAIQNAAAPLIAHEAATKLAKAVNEEMEGIASDEEPAAKPTEAIPENKNEKETEKVESNPVPLDEPKKIPHRIERVEDLNDHKEVKQKSKFWKMLCIMFSAVSSIGVLIIGLLTFRKVQKCEKNTSMEKDKFLHSPETSEPPLPAYTDSKGYSRVSFSRSD